MLESSLPSTMEVVMRVLECSKAPFYFHLDHVPSVEQFTLANSPYLVTGPVARFARQIAGQGYIVAAPSSYHEFTGPEPLAYDGPGTDAGNEWKIKKVLRFPNPVCQTSLIKNLRLSQATTKMPLSQ